MSDRHLRKMPSFASLRADQKDAWLRLSTGIKMMLILAAALLPLGLIAVLASIESAAQNRAARHADTEIATADLAAKLNTIIGRAAVTMRATATALALNSTSAPACRRTLETLAGTLGADVRLAMFGANGQPICATAGFRPGMPVLPGGSTDYRVTIDPSGAGLIVTIRGATGTTAAVGLLSRRMLAAAAADMTSVPAQATLVWNGRNIVLLRQDGTTHAAVASAPLVGGEVRLDLAAKAVPIRPVEIVTILLPIVMLVAAAVIGWLVLDQLLLRPLGQLQRAVAAYRPGGASLVLPPLNTPATEIRRLSHEFEQLTSLVARHEADLEEGLSRQTRLTREVHHRVKNNLQVIASLINLHARGATSAEGAAAYLSIQRRVDALAVVHRNHYAEYEQNKGVALRPLVQELAGNLKGSADGSGGLSLSIAIESLHVTQDVAVAVAFLLTELIELAMVCAPGPSIAIRLRREGPLRARLSLSSSAFLPSETLTRTLAKRFGRVIEGLARQLRTPLEHDPEAGTYSLTLATLD